MSTNVYRRDPHRGWRVWHISEIYTGELEQSDSVLQVPNPDDLVFDGKGFRRVVAVDELAIPTLAAVDLSHEPEHITDPDSLREGLVSYQPHVGESIFIDNSTSPPTLSVDARCRIYGSESTQVRFYLGTDISEQGNAISLSLDSQGNVVNENIDLVPVYPGNLAIKRPARAHSSQPIDTGEVITMVIYNASGTATGKISFIARDCAAIAGPTANGVYITDIELRSKYISHESPLLLEVPLNVPLSLDSLICRVHYSSGIPLDLPIDGNRVKLHGFNNFNTGILGPIHRLILSYYPDADEPAINLGTGPVPSLSKEYGITGITENDVFALKLYLVPVYVEGSGYRLEFRLTNLAGDLDVDVTDDVSVLQSSGVQFDPADFGNAQTLDLHLNLDTTLPGLYPDHRHAQRVDLTLYEPNGISDDAWVIDYVGDGITTYGLDIHASASPLGDRRFVLHNNLGGRDTWLSKLYHAIQPMFDNKVLDTAPTPTHFRLEHGPAGSNSHIGTYPLDAWDNVFELQGKVPGTSPTRSTSYGWCRPTVKSRCWGFLRCRSSTTTPAKQKYYRGLPRGSIFYYIVKAIYWLTPLFMSAERGVEL